MRILDIDNLEPPNEKVKTFQGIEHGANASFFIVRFTTGEGPRKHRHPYEETFIILEGEIEVFVGQEIFRIDSGKIAIIPKGIWHTFTVRSETPALMVNIHPVPKMLTEWA